MLATSCSLLYMRAVSSASAACEANVCSTFMSSSENAPSSAENTMSTPMERPRASSGTAIIEREP